ncbi:MAG: hypothetical protein CMO98_03755 [Woeseia sp.]|nr:hypothetical protein [Woeseia sp.]|tara:strand:- start:1978 stop:3885 length:1908 start_codon:yes stop_codon:yes gene_type:complete
MNYLYRIIAVIVISGSSAYAADFGKYTNPEASQFDGWDRTSRYIKAEDGTRLAIDLFIPTLNGEQPAEKIPVVLHYTRYIRATEREDGPIVSAPIRDPVAQHLLRHGYAVAIADARGTGASFGVHNGAFSIEETADSYTIIEWLASRPWSNGNIGMSGRSYPGMTQYQAATQNPPSLKAIFAEMAGPSGYDFIYRGGAFKKDFIDMWGSSTKSLDLAIHQMPARVDADIDGSLRDQAVAEHKNNLWAQSLIQPGSHLRNFGITREGGGRWSWDQVTTIDSGNIDIISDSGIGIYHLAGWYDIYTTQQAWFYAELERHVSQKMMIGPWMHSGGYGGKVHLAEILRWYDYWLKGIENGVLDEPPVHYYTMRGNHTTPENAATVAPTLDEATAEDGSAWEATSVWPPKATKVRFWLDQGSSGTVTSINDGVLSYVAPVEVGSNKYKVDYTSTVGKFSRWMNGYGGRRNDIENSTYLDERTKENQKGLTYTSDPLDEEMQLVGYPTMHMRVESSHDDGDFFVYLEEIDSAGKSHYITEGVLRGSHRKTSQAPFENFGLPFHRSYEEDLAPMQAGQPVDLAFDLMGTAITLDAGHRIRVTITGADANNFALYPDPTGKDAPIIEVFTGSHSGSYVDLPTL